MEKVKHYNGPVKVNANYKLNGEKKIYVHVFNTLSGSVYLMQ